MKAPLSELQQLVVDAATEKKASDIIVLDLRTRTDLTDYFMICSGKSKVQVQAIADNIREEHPELANPLIERWTGSSQQFAKV